MIRHTTSQLGAQMTPNAWVMNTVFFLLGAACIIESWFYLKKYWFQKILLTIFGLSLIFTAIYQHAPVNLDLAYDLREDQLHSFFASVVGFSFTIFVIKCLKVQEVVFIEINPLLCPFNAVRDRDPLVKIKEPLNIRLFAGRYDSKSVGLPFRFLLKKLKVPEGDFRKWDEITK